MVNPSLKKILLLTLTIILSLISLTTQKASVFLQETDQRTLQYIEYNPKGIYYLLEFPKNDITGTGDKLQDIPYKALCIIKACESACCTGDITSMKCGTAEECKTFFDSTRRGNVAAAVIIPIAVTAIFFVAFFLLWKKFKVSWDLSALLAFICMFVVTIPFVILYVWKYKPFVANSADKKSEQNNLFKSGKEVELINQADKIILCDNKKVADTERFSGNNYNKLSADDDLNKNLNIISISNKAENGLKRGNMPDIVFDENLKDEAGSNQHSYNKQKSNNDFNNELSENNSRRKVSVPNENKEENYNSENCENGENINNEENDALEKSHYSQARSRKSQNDASRNSRPQSNENRSVKSANNKSNVNDEEETPDAENNANVSVNEQKEVDENKNENSDENDDNNNNNNEAVDKDEQPAEPKEGEGNGDDNNDNNGDNNNNDEQNKENSVEAKEEGNAENNIENNEENNPVEDA